MDDERHELVRIDATGTAHPLGKTASQQLRARQGSFRLMPTPAHLVVLRFVGEDGKRNDQNGPVFRLAGEITAPGALCDIVGLVGQASWSGELLVLDGEITRSMFFERGHVIGAQSSSENERIGEVLYRYGALSREQVHETARAVTTDLRFGEAAVMLGFLTRERLFQLITRQTEEIVFAVLLVGDGMFYFLDNFGKNDNWRIWVPNCDGCVRNQRSKLAVGPWSYLEHEPRWKANITWVWDGKVIPWPDDHATVSRHLRPARDARLVGEVR